MMTDSAAAFALIGVNKEFLAGDSRIPVLRDIDLIIPQGQYVSIVGPSGSGKSTLMQLLGCLDHPTTGSLTVFGQETSGLSDDDLSTLRCRRIGFVFQAFHLLPGYDAASNVALAMAYGGHENRWERARELLEKLGLGHRLNHKPPTLSGGEKQRVAIARALSNDPAIILADEPTGALDVHTGILVLDAIQKTCESLGTTTVIITHNVTIADMADRVIHLVDGQIKDIKKNHRRASAQELKW
jgi:putative ABC transport system ATP-binding protein